MKNIKSIIIFLLVGVFVSGIGVLAGQFHFVNSNGTAGNNVGSRVVIVPQ